MRQHLSYANVMATVAVFIALGGTSYALTLPRNSVGAAQLREGAVRSSELRSRAVRSRHIRNRSVGLQDISLATRTALSGKSGPPGQPGPAGPSGIPLSVAVNAAGEAVSGNSSGYAHAETGIYSVSFHLGDMTGCRATATLSRVPGGTPEEPPAGEITTSTTTTGVTVKTFNSAGTLTDLPFHLIAVC